MFKELFLSEHCACRHAVAFRTTYHEPPSMNESTANLSMCIVKLAHDRPRFGYRRITIC